MPNMNVYLCGPIDGCSDAECKNWREAFKRMWGADKCIDPMRRDGRGRQDEPGIVAEIVEGDKHDIYASAAMLIYYYQPSVGTSMEILYAWSIGRPMVLVNASGRQIRDLSYWIRYHVGDANIVKDLAGAVRTLHDILLP